MTERRRASGGRARPSGRRGRYDVADDAGAGRAGDPPEAIVAGHLCLDIIPAFPGPVGDLARAMKPGALVEVGPAAMSTGGAVSNTGLALHRLGIRTRLMGKIGDDEFGRIIREFVRRIDPALAGGLIVAPGETSSYTVVVNPPDVDRIFLHCAGANATFEAGDVRDEALRGARLFHFGYPPLMRRTYADGGRDLESLFRRAKALGLTTSLDLSLPDPQSPAARADWAGILRRTLPHVDVFLPSLDEMRLLLGWRGERLRELTGRLRGWGARIAGVKLGDEGLFVDWGADTFRAPCFKVRVAGTTGAGDATIAGFLAGLLKGLPPAEVVTAAVAVGACSCEAPDATSGIRPWDEVQARIRSGWPRRAVARWAE
jgi:sugar/nucleoside kinase (ribokinase family)